MGPCQLCVTERERDGGGGWRWRGREELVLFLRSYVANRDGYIRASEGERDGREERVVSRTNRREREKI